MFINKSGDWTDFRKLPGLLEVDFHLAEEQPTGAYWEHMDQVKETTLNSLRKAQKDGRQYVLFTHGHSTSRIGAQTSRSVVRGVMRSKEATPYIIRRESIQHSSVFVAKIRPLK
jgi:hypothetical protein